MNLFKVKPFIVGSSVAEVTHNCNPKTEYINSCTLYYTGVYPVWYSISLF